MKKKVQKTKLIKIGILTGGPSSEHEVSLDTGRNVFENLDRTKYEPSVIKITKDSKWFLGGKPTTPDKIFKFCDVVFNALHGYFGEDGKIQAILEHNGVRYTGSGVASSAIAMDKFHSRELFKLAGINVPKTLKLLRGENYLARLQFFVNKISKFPVVVKPCSDGSSIGVTIVEKFFGLNKAVSSAFKKGKEILIEEFIKGREVTCGVLDNLGGESVALPVTEIIPIKGHKFFNYDSKYKTGHCNEITPAQINEAIREKVQEIAIRAHQLLNCRGYSRTDMILKNDSVYVLETNTLPGFTTNSLFPQEAKAFGLTFSQLLDKIIESSL
ncbi:MAG: D-alanine--D-alanine ligase [Candidatus Yanofskybacteria bacterium CG10_big_fil_rev_8_21_14_0_10_37_15]|uniref:D-alanine--D-alanine ligase n=1 Tax=Candidatus Yanofskybacteria bacterium CG10_big_fil_rev_8_21_14_0_10_37_15 TaxID=1975097 RepID=A0A2H0R5S1_9BACT|nr:MAG: D-alanine--D-alanine ligase [Candidatus Yanofskybacteria bacterium CG10_big_fil_rev_8_21_14_0_10_37_15]